jgi:hypothetical protein
MENECAQHHRAAEEVVSLEKVSFSLASREQQSLKKFLKL